MTPSTGSRPTSTKNAESRPTLVRWIGGPTNGERIRPAAWLRSNAAKMTTAAPAKCVARTHARREHAVTIPLAQNQMKLVALMTIPVMTQIHQPHVVPTPSAAASSRVVGTRRPTFVDSVDTNGESFTVLQELKSAIPGKKRVSRPRSAFGSFSLGSMQPSAAKDRPGQA